MNQTIYNQLLQVARIGGITNYSNIAHLVGLDMASPNDREEISQLLDEISSFEYDEGRPLLSAVVIRQDTNIPGNGFFTHATRLDIHAQHDNMLFFVQELRRVHDFWRDH